MQLTTSALVLLVLQLQVFSVRGCDGHGAHQANDQHNMTEHQRRRRLKILDELPCGSPQTTKQEKREAGKALQNWKKKKNNGKKRELFETLYRIPVTFHVLRRSNGSGNVSNSQLNQYLQHLNDAFAGSPFTFYKKATTRTNNDAWHFCDYDTLTQVGQAGDTLRRGGVADIDPTASPIAEPTAAPIGARLIEEPTPAPSQSQAGTTSSFRCEARDSCLRFLGRGGWKLHKMTWDGKRCRERCVGFLRAARLLEKPNGFVCGGCN